MSNIILRRAMIKVFVFSMLTAATLLTYMRVSAAVTVSSFNAQAQGTGILLTWTTASETNNVGFHLLRSNSSGGSFSQINANIIPSKCLGCIAGASYSYADTAISPGQTYFYKLQSVDSRGNPQLFGPKSAGVPATAVPTATFTPVPPTATQPPVPAATYTSVNTPVPPTATLPSDSQGTRSAAVAPTTPATPRAPTSSTQSPIPTHVAILVQPTAPLLIPVTGEQVPPPSVVAMAIKEYPPDTSVEESAETADSQDQSYYVRRLVSVGVILSSGILMVGAVALGAAALYFFLRAHLHQ